MTNRKAIVTDEHRQEALLLADLWERLPHTSQAVFGEQYGIGSQSAVGQFLRGDTPLSLKAAAGFAEGLGCKIRDFSPRLAEQAIHFAGLAGTSDSPASIADLSKFEIQLILMVRSMTKESVDTITQVAQELYKSSQHSKTPAAASPPGPPAKPKPVKSASKRHKETADH
ncbi:MAG: hypothetical protein LBJ40_22710 [Delftia acidovorans]|jgi:hypothetical protein|nr:hypothetical protein [Delftia acidovorans]